jgi:hypothetical protein
MWLEITAKDETGKTVMTIGGITAEGSLPENTCVFNSNAVAIEARLRYRQADQKGAEALLAAVPKEIDLEKIYGLKVMPPLSVVDMVLIKASFPASQ